MTKNLIFVHKDCIDNTKDHTQAMKLLEEAGIYVFTVRPSPSAVSKRLGIYGTNLRNVRVKVVSTPWNSISRFDPRKSYNPDNMTSFFKTVDVMAGFSNTLGILAANTLVNNDATLPIAAFIKAVVRDLKRYMKVKHEADGQRVLPVGYNAATGSARDKSVLMYLTPGSDDHSLDFWTVSRIAGSLKTR